MNSTRVNIHAVFYILGSCSRPSGWCSHSGGYQFQDCDGDGVCALLKIFLKHFNSQFKIGLGLKLCVFFLNV